MSKQIKCYWCANCGAYEYVMIDTDKHDDHPYKWCGQCKCAMRPSKNGFKFTQISKPFRDCL